MKILQVHKYFSKENGGGSVTAFFETIQLLEKNGHEVVVFSMEDEKNEPSESSEFFAEHFDINEVKGLWNKIKLIPKVIWNCEAQEKLEKLLAVEKPDIAHVHNIYHYLTPAILHTLKKYKIPIVFKLSDYKAICPNYKLFINGSVCEKCKGHKYYNCFFNVCLKRSYLASFIGMIEAYVHWIKGSYEKIDYFLAPSEFMKEKCVDFGIEEDRIRILRNVINVENFNLEQEFIEEDYFLSLGRVSEEKGIDYLILAFKEFVDENPEMKTMLMIIGKGPQRDALKDLVRELGGLDTRVVFPGFIRGEERDDLIRKSKGVVISSVWYDNSPLVISEAQLLGKPVIVSDRGGSQEMILENESGFIYPAQSIEELKKTIVKLLVLSLDKRKEMGIKGRENILKINSEEEYYSKLMEFYQQAIDKKE
jgi:glycosyltransferase involved in cell wall biosynthesis